MNQTISRVFAQLRSASLLPLSCFALSVASADEPAVEKKRQVILKPSAAPFANISSNNGRVSIRSIGLDSPVNTSHSSLVTTLRVGEKVVIMPKTEAPGEVDVKLAEVSAQETSSAIEALQRELLPVSGTATKPKKAYVGDY